MLFYIPGKLNHPYWCGQIQGLKEELTNGEEEGVKAHTLSSRNLSKEPVDNGNTANLGEDRKEQRSPPGPAPDPLAKLLPMTVLPCVSSLIAVLKFRNGLEFPQLSIGTQLGFEYTPSPSIPQTYRSLGSRA